MDSKQSDRESVASKRSSRSSTSSAGSVTRARAKAEAAKARATFANKEAKAKLERAATEAKLQKEKAEKEAEYYKEKAAIEFELQLEKARKDAELEALASYREAASAEAEAAVWEDAMDNFVVLDEAGPSEKDKLERTSEYVQSQYELHSGETHPRTRSLRQAAMNASSQVSQLPTDETHQGYSSNPFSPTWQPPVSPKEPSYAKNITNPALANYGSENVQTPSAIKVERQVPRKETDHQTNINMRNAYSNNPPQPSLPHFISTASHGAPGAEHLAQFLARRDLVSSSLYKFDDNPENYRAWHSSYINATQGLGLTATEELDLMTKWLGRESSDQVRRLRSVHATNPVVALRRAWERLQECYAAPEVIERSLFNRLDHFPRLSGKEHTKLRELANLLMEVQGAKEDGYLPGLSYLDTARGIEPIVAKLPYGLQERWFNYALGKRLSNYSQVYRV
ncbi:uncharacterized protein LOC134102933 [Pungitius pungitius]|uniref:uncharacterized protein LOC134102933 n=1 Tax=Pungitius pungitius TaxID=134920 RepID=UPI002E13A3E7